MEDTALIGASQIVTEDRADGAAYLYERRDGTFTNQREFFPPDEGQRTGSKAVAIAGDTLFIGIGMGDDPDEPDAEQVYVFQRSDGAVQRQTRLTADDGDHDLGFGDTISVDEFRAVVGAPPNRRDTTGKAYVFEQTDGRWQTQEILEPADPRPDDPVFFGATVGLDGETILVGAPGDDDNGSTAGAAYLFRRTGDSWTQEIKFGPEDGGAQDEFGEAVTVSGDRALVGAPEDEHPNGLDAGSAYLFSVG